MSQDLYRYLPVILLIFMGILIVAGTLLVGRLIRPHNPTPLKRTPYECGEIPTGQAWSKFNMRFYIVSLVFIIFDVEAVLLFPVAAVFKQFNEAGNGGVLLVTFLIFILVLLVGLIYCWRKGDLDWVKSYNPATSDEKN